MNLSEEQIKKEEQYFDKIVELITNYIKIINQKISKSDKEIIELKKHIWDQGKAMSELEYGSMLADADFEVSLVNKQVEQLNRYEKMLKNPYFGRIDFKTDEEIFNVYIGISGLTDEENNYIFDWRAPISSLFYNYDFGPAQYDSPSGNIFGEIVLRRQYKFEQGNLKRIIENKLNIDDEILQEVLSKNSNSKMQNIVSTIQKEQNEIIRNASDKVLIVQGIAGSGKTSVAMHRVAYILYREKEIKHDDIIIFSPNTVFGEYIGEILPDLGEKNVLNYTFQSFFSKYYSALKKSESLSDFLERNYENKNTTNICNKLDIDNFMESYLKNNIFKKNVVIQNIVFSNYELNNLILQKYNKLPFIERIKSVSEYLCRKLNISTIKNSKKIMRLLLDKLSLSVDPVDIYNSFLKSNLSNKNSIKYDDIVNILYIYFEINGYPCVSNVKHIVIDEAQDYNDIQFYILKKVFLNASFTILGDINQMINPNCNYQNLYEITKIFENNIKYIELNKTYRSSPEITDFSNTILNKKNINSVRKATGFPVMFRNNEKLIENIGKDIQLMKANGLKNIAIIVKNKKELTSLYNKLSDCYSNLTFTKNSIVNGTISILTSYMSKGLEFDGVIVYTDIENQYTEYEKNLFYVVCTRAQHQLIIYNQDISYNYQ